MMSKRKALPGIDELINPTSPHSPVSTRADERSRDDIKQSSRQVVKSSDKIKKEQLTVYLDSEVSLRLEEAQLKLRRMTGKKGYATSRSSVIEHAVLMALNDLDANGSNSTLASLIAGD